MSQDEPPKAVTLTRRDALKALGVGTGIALTPAIVVSRPIASVEEKRADVIIVGAGFGGLTAARNIQQEGRSVAVLEARDRVGGRVKGGRLAGRAVDVGGMWVGPTQTRRLELLNEYGLHTMPQFEEGKGIVELKGKRTLPDREALGFDSETQAEYERVLSELNRLSSTSAAGRTMDNAGSRSVRRHDRRGLV